MAAANDVRFMMLCVLSCKGSPFPLNLSREISYNRVGISLLQGFYRDALHLFAWRGVGLAGEVHGHVLLQGQDAQLQLLGALGQPPQAIEEGTAVVEIVGHEAAIGKQAGAVATVGDTQ